MIIPGDHAYTYGGLRVAIVRPDRGEIDAVALSFVEHGTYHGPGRPPWEGAVTTGLRDAIEQYTAGWFPGAVDPRTAWVFPYDESRPFARTDDGAAAAFGPCLRLQTTCEPQPDRPDKGAWTVTAHRAPFTAPAWRITFGATTPSTCSTSTSKTATAAKSGCSRTRPRRTRRTCSSSEVARALR
ncbi:DUF317 domain-containing protein [Streptomyces sp. NBC_00988]|uniref:DUF317 domain-containing protein n=1 Tax=Streptomyces sp. NBC_00988 TaxID=2903704 RepID=UPI003867F2A4|nr:DUF317 domain-containing protein [Streptomyces sp. NBC_00988]